MFYLAQRFTSEFSKVRKNAGIVFSKITKFCEENTISISGKPFIIYHIYDKNKELTKLSICIPIKNHIFISEGSDIVSDTLKPFQAIKSTLIGDYSHSRKALDKTVAYLGSKYITPDKKFSHIEVYAIGKNEVNNPSKWVTEIYAPIKQKVVVKPVDLILSTNDKIAPKLQVEKEVPSEF
jgi:effector-binding domain-containing protein